MSDYGQLFVSFDWILSCVLTISPAYLITYMYTSILYSSQSLQDQELPSPLNELVNSFCLYMKNQKSIQDEFLSFNDKQMKKIQRETSAQSQVHTYDV